MIFSLPNLLTGFRFALIPLLIVLFAIDQSKIVELWSCIVFTVAALTDFVDGWVARKYHTESVLGQLMDPLADKVLVYGDCAINPNPDAEQLADIAITSADTARMFGIEPRVAMLSYSTGDSGKGAAVDKVIEATRIATRRRPDLKLEGPIQYDAAVDASVAKTKLPGSQVAGQATVFVFPDLNTGNNTYKAVQRSADAVAIGPVLQGLNKPVNDLSRGCTVTDIVNTVCDQFMIHSLESHMQTIRGMVQKHQEQLEDLKRKMKKSKQAMIDFIEKEKLAVRGSSVNIVGGNDALMTILGFEDRESMLSTNVWDVLFYVAPHLVLSWMISARVHGSTRHSFWPEVYEVAVAPYVAYVTTLAVVSPKHGKFNVTDKGSVIEKALRISPSSRGCSHCSFCSSVPNMWRISMFPVLGASQLNTSGAKCGAWPVSSAICTLEINPDLRIVLRILNWLMALVISLFAGCMVT